MFKLLFLFIIFSIQAHAKVVDKVIAIVNDDIISLSDLEEFKKKTKGDEGLTQKKILDALIEETLLHQLVKKLNLSATEAEVNAHIDSILKNQDMSQTDLLRFLKQRGITYTNYKESIKKSIEQQKLLERELHSSITIKKEDIRAYYYNTIKNKSSKKQYHIRQIFFPLEAAALKKAQAAYASYKGGLSFEQVIKKHVTTVEGQSSSGDLGFLNEEDMSGPFKKVVLGLSLKKLSKPFQTKVGVHLVEILEVQKQSSQSFDEVKDEIQKILYEKEFQKVLKNWIKTKKEQAFIKIIK